MSFQVDVFWSFRSPYCYFALDRLLDIQRRYQAEIVIRPVYPMAVRNPSFFDTVNPLYRSYHTLDSKRVAEYLGLPYRRPVPDPIVQDPQTRAFAAQQPHIHRLTRLGAAAQMAGRSADFVERASRLLWDGGTDDWHLGDHLTGALLGAGLEPGLIHEVENNPDVYETQIEANQRAHAASGHWGVPTMVFENEPFYGQDRVELLFWRMRRKGLACRD